MSIDEEIEMSVTNPHTCKDIFSIYPHAITSVAPLDATALIAIRDVCVCLVA